MVVYKKISIFLLKVLCFLYTLSIQQCIKTCINYLTINSIKKFDSYYRNYTLFLNPV